MLVCEVVNLISPSAFDRTGSPMKLPSMYKNTNYGKQTRIKPMTVTVKSSGKDGKIYGRRTIMSK